MKSILAILGPLRAMLAASTLILVALRPFAGGRVIYTDWHILPTMVVPALVPIFFFVLLLDMMMAAVFRSSADDAGQARFTRVLYIEAALVVLLLAAWLPFFLSLGS